MSKSVDMDIQSWTHRSGGVNMNIPRYAGGNLLAWIFSAIQAGAKMLTWISSHGQAGRSKCTWANFQSYVEALRYGPGYSILCVHE